MKRYLRFGKIPEDKISRIHRGDGILGEEKGVSVWDCTFVDDVPFPILPDDSSEDGLADYFYSLLGDKPVYLVTGTEIGKGYVGEPVLDKDIKIILEYTNVYEYIKTILNKNHVINKVGKWLPPEFNLSNNSDRYKCSFCNRFTNVEIVMGRPLFRYCPYCGTYMEEEKVVLD